jgi:hypothetical protein
MASPKAIGMQDAAVKLRQIKAGDLSNSAKICFHIGKKSHGQAVGFAIGSRANGLAV